MLSALWGRAADAIDATMPARPMAMLRIAIGALALIRSVPLAASARDGSREPVDTSAVLDLFGVPDASALPMPAGAMPLAWAVFVLAAAGTLVGYRTRLSCALLAATCLYVTQTVVAFRYNHLYTLGLLALVLACSGSGRAWSVDVWRHPGSARDRIAAWPAWLVRVQLSIIYLYAAVAKVNEDFLSGAVSHFWMTWSPYLSWSPPTDLRLWVAVGIAVILAEIVVAIGPWWPGLRPLAFAVAGVLHVSFLALAVNPSELTYLVVFGGLMLAALALHLPGEPRSIEVGYDPSCGRCRRFAATARRYDRLGVLVLEARPGPTTARVGDRTVSGAAARRRVLGSLPGPHLLAPWSWLLPAPLADRIARCSGCRDGSRHDPPLGSGPASGANVLAPGS